MKRIMNNNQILAKKSYMLVTLALQSQNKIYINLFGFKKLQRTCKVELSVCPKKGNARCFAYVTVSYHVYKEIVKSNGVVFRSNSIKIKDAKVKPKKRSQQYKISGNSYNPEKQ